jgi:glutaredoxin
MTDPDIIVYGTEWCGDCRRARRFLEFKKIPYQFVNIDQDKAGETFVLQNNRGMRSVPTILFPDGSIHVEPSNLALARKLGLE